MELPLLFAEVGEVVVGTSTRADFLQQLARAERTFARPNAVDAHFSTLLGQVRRSMQILDGIPDNDDLLPLLTSLLDRIIDAMDLGGTSG